MAGQVHEGGELQPVERDMGAVEVDHVDARRPAAEIGEHVAAAGADGHDAVALFQRHRLHVDFRVFPDLRIDEPGKQQREQALREPLRGERAVPVERLAEMPPAAARKARFRCDIRHELCLPLPVQERVRAGGYTRMTGR